MDKSMAKRGETVRKSKRRVPELKVMFDTSAIYTGSASDLFNADVTDLIEQNSSHSDLRVSWYLPDPAIHERRYQMRVAAHNLLPSIKKLERLLGHNLNLTEEVVDERIDKCIDRQLAKHGVQIAKLEVGIVNWQRLIEDSLYRKPPFEKGEKEKGFRDALIAETFLQLVADSPQTSRICRLAFVSNDTLLRETVEQKTSDRKNVRIAATLDDIKGLINTLVSAVEEEFVKEILPLASRLFFKKDDESTLYYKEEIHKRIEEEFSGELNNLPQGADRRRNETWYISASRFLKKYRQRVYWVTRVDVTAKAFQTSYPYLQPWAATPIKLGGEGQISQQKTLSDILKGTASFLPELTSEELVAEGRTSFEVVWSVTVSVRKALSSPRIESIELVGTTWD